MRPALFGTNQNELRGRLDAAGLRPVTARGSADLVRETQGQAALMAILGLGKGLTVLERCLDCNRRRGGAGILSRGGQPARCIRLGGKRVTERTDQSRRLAA